MCMSIWAPAVRSMGERRDRPAPATEESTMAQYLLSVHSVEGEVSGPTSAEEMQQFMKRVNALEEEMRSTNTYVFGGALHDPDTATVVRVSGGDVLTTDGPFAESKGHLGGFYIIETEH